MKRNGMQCLLSIFCCSLILGSAPVPAFAQVGRLPFIQGIRAPTTVGQRPLIAATPAMPSALIPAYAPHSAAVVAKPYGSVGRVLTTSGGGTSSPYGSVAFAAVKNLAAAIGDEVDVFKDGDVADASNKVFDGGDGDGTVGGVPVASNGARLDQLYPRVVFLLDVFQGPISERFARYLNTLVDQKVQLVIVTDRPESGPGSITEVALSKLKAHRANGVIVVSNNGGKIFGYGSSRSQSHAPLVPNVDGFPAPVLEVFSALNASLAGRYSIPAPIETRYDDGKGKKTQTLSYALSLPRSMSEPVSPKSKRLKADEWLVAMNAGLKKAGAPYTFDLYEDAGKGLSAVTHATPLRGSLGRIREALKVSLNGTDPLTERPEQVLIIADPAWWKSFHNQPEIAKVNFLGATNAAQAETQIGAMLGDLSLEQAYVDRYMVESYVRWKHYQGGTRRESEDLDGPRRSGGGMRASKDGREMGPMYLWRAAVVSKILELMGKELRDGSWVELKDRTLDGYVSTLYKGKELRVGSQVYMPFQNETVLKARSQSLWSKYAGTHVGYVQRFVQNLKKTLLPLFPMDVREFGQTIHRMGAEATSRTTLLFRNLITGRLYKVGVRVPMSRLDMTPEGQTFYGHVPRTGKRVVEVDDFTAKMMALALLKADGVVKKADGTWEVNHRPLEQIEIDFHYYRVTIPYVFKPADLAGVEQEVTSVIEKMLNEPEFIKHYEETMDDRKKDKETTKAGAAKKKEAATVKRRAAKPAAESTPKRRR